MIRKSQTFKPGDYMFLLKGPKLGKFGDQYTGPHELLEILNIRNNMKIRITKIAELCIPIDGESILNQLPTTK